MALLSAPERAAEKGEKERKKKKEKERVFGLQHSEFLRGFIMVSYTYSLVMFELLEYSILRNVLFSS